MKLEFTDVHVSNIWTRVYNLGNRLRVSYLITYSHIAYFIYSHMRYTNLDCSAVYDIYCINIWGP